MTTPAFDPKTVEADAIAVVSDTAPMEFWAAIADEPSPVRQVRIVRDYLDGANLRVSLAVVRWIAAAQR
jgi:hypothetical protein